jgi:signal transduction histidine kinase
VQKYSDLTNIIGNTLQQLELNTDLIMHNAAYAVLAKINLKKTIPPNEKLRKFSKELDVNNIYITNNKGQFIRSTKEPPSALPNIFSFCEQYQKWFEKEIPFPPTGIIISKPSKIPYKFYIVSAANKKFLVEIGMEAKFIGNTLKNAIGSNKNILSIEIISPNGKSLGKYTKAGNVHFNDKLETSENKFNRIDFKDDRILINKKVEAVNQYCCSCVRNGITQNNKYYYVLRLTVSTNYIKNYQNHLLIWLSVILLISTILSAVISHLISNRVVSRISRISREFTRVAKNGFKNEKVHVDGSDEISEMADILNNTIEELKNKQLRLFEVEKEAAKVKLAQQVAHDIRSPITVLDILTRDSFTIPEKQRLMLRNAMQRIRDVANNLLEQQRVKENDDRLALEFIPDLIQCVISEKRTLYQDKKITLELNIDDNAKACFSKIVPGKFKRVMSNLLNNAVESIIDQGNINIRLGRNKDSINIIIEDTGKGISQEYIPKLLSGEPFSIGKSGTGMGLSHAISTLKEYSGTINIYSEKNVGTKVIITLPWISPPSWFSESLTLNTGGVIVILDDDPSIHDVWRERLVNKFATLNNIFNFYSPQNFIDWVSQNETKVDLFLIDYEFIGYPITGLEVIEQFNIANKSYLVTSCYDQPDIREKSERLNVKIIPKCYANDIPVTARNNKPLGRRTELYIDPN